MNESERQGKLSMHQSVLSACTVVLIALYLWSMPVRAQAIKHRSNGDGKLRAILDYICSGWDILTCSTTACAGVADAKLN
jgi:hypothetical protein